MSVTLDRVFETFALQAPPLTMSLNLCTYVPSMDSKLGRSVVWVRFTLSYRPSLKTWGRLKHLPGNAFLRAGTPNLLMEAILDRGLSVLNLHLRSLFD